MDTVVTQDNERAHVQLVPLISHALSIQRDAGAVVAWIYLSRLDVPDSKILQVLTNGDDLREFSAEGAHEAG